MPRFLIPPEQIRGDRFTLKGSEARHALTVLRKKIGDTLDLFDGKNRAFSGRIEFIAEQEIQGRIEASAVTDVALPINLTLYQALIRGPKWDWLVEKASELGVARLVPVLAARCIVKPDSDAHKLERWERIAEGSAKQCGRSTVMTVDSPLPLAMAFGRLAKGSLALIPWEKEAKHSVRDACRSFKGKDVQVFIGPEGGWEPAEVELARKSDVMPVRLGPLLLRSETAGIVASTIVLTELGVFA